MAFREILRSRVLEVLLAKKDVAVILATTPACEVQESDLPADGQIHARVVDLKLPRSWRGQLAYRLDKILHAVTKDLAAVLYPDTTLAQMRFSRLRSNKQNIGLRLLPSRLLKAFGLRNHHLAALGENWGHYPEFARLLDEEKPNIVVYSNMMLGQMDCLREARRRQIPLLLDVPTWDQATSKGPMTVRPDHAIAWSNEMRDDLVRLHNLQAEHIFVGGVLYFDAYFDRPTIESREDYCRRLKIDPRKKIVTYCLSRAGSSPAALAFIDRIHEIIRDGRLGMDCQLVVRTNPLDNVNLVKELALRPFAALQLPKGRVDSSGSNWLPAVDEAADRIAALLYSDVLVMIQSTMILDGCCTDRPIINLAYDAGQQVNEWQSVKRIFHFNHARRYQEIGATWKVASNAELETALKTYLYHPETHCEQRHQLLKDLTAFHDGRTFERWANYVYETARTHAPV